MRAAIEASRVEVANSAVSYALFFLLEGNATLKDYFNSQHEKK